MLGDEYLYASDPIARLLRGVRTGSPCTFVRRSSTGRLEQGKTSLLNSLLDHHVEMPNVVFPCASVADGSFGGMPVQWATKRVSAPFELIRQSKVANPVVVLDEIEKTGSSTSNGSSLHSLLPILERHTSPD
nr:hypothetical protein [Aureimonas sp. AU4]